MECSKEEVMERGKFVCKEVKECAHKHAQANSTSMPKCNSDRLQATKAVEATNKREKKIKIARMENC